ncbi:Probable polygalacturonase [Linum perenne]
MTERESEAASLRTEIRESDLTLVPNFESSLPEIGKIPARKTVMSIKDFGGNGDGETTNTNVFQDAIRHMKQFGSSGGSQLNVPKGRWLTGSFNLTSNFTLFLEDGDVILGSQSRPRPVVRPDISSKFQKQLNQIRPPSSYRDMEERRGVHSRTSWRLTTLSRASSSVLEIRSLRIGAEMILKTRGMSGSR